MKKLLAVLLTLVLLMFTGLSALAASVVPVPQDSNHVDIEGFTKFKPFESVSQMVYNPSTVSDGVLSVTFEITEQGTKLTWWDANIPVSHVYVKGGTGGGGNLYTYPDGKYTDSELTALTNNQNILQQISHVVFYYQVGNNGDNSNPPPAVGDGDNSNPPPAVGDGDNTNPPPTDDDGDENNIPGPPDGDGDQENQNPVSNPISFVPVTIVYVAPEQPTAVQTEDEQPEEAVEEEEELIVIDIAPEAAAGAEEELPRTSASDIIFYGLGALLSAGGVIIRRKAK